MAEEIILGLKLDTSGTRQPIADLEAGLARMKEEIKTLPSDSAAFKKVASEIRKVDAELKNVNKGLEGLSREKISESLGKIVGGAGAAVAGFALLAQAFGATKESAAEMQAAFNTAFGAINAVKGIVELFQGLGAIIPAATTAFKAFDTAMKFSVVGIIALAIGGLAYAISGVAKEEEKAEDATDRWNKKLDEQRKRIEDLVYEYQQLDKIVTQYNKAFEESTKTAIDYKNAIEESRQISAAFSDEKRIALLSDEELTKVLSNLESAQNKVIDGNLKQIQTYSELKDNSDLRAIYLQKEINKYTELQSQVERYRTVTITGGGISGTGGSTITTETQEYKFYSALIEAANKKLTEAKSVNLEITKRLTEAEQELGKVYKDGQGIVKNTLNSLREEADKRGIVSGEVAKQKEAEERLRQEYEKSIQRQRDLNDLLDEYSFLRREINIRDTNEGIDIAEERNLALLDREREYQEKRKEIQRSEILNTQQKNEALKLVEEQYRLDLIDINADYDRQEQDAYLKKKEEQKKIDEEIAAEQLDIKKRTLLAIAEAEDIQAGHSLESQINLLEKQREAELLNEKLTAEEKYLINLRYEEKIAKLQNDYEQKEFQRRKQLQSDLIGLYSQFADIAKNIWQGNLEAFQRTQEKELEVFNNSKDAELESLEAQAEDDIVIKNNLEAERKRIEKEKEIFQAEQEERLKQKQKRQAGFELGLLLGQSIANIAAAILKAQVNPGFPLSIEEIIRISALGLTQVGAITAQINKVYSFASGGVISGPSHANGGVKYAVGGQVNELEGGEGVINKKSMGLPGVAEAASYLNQLGGGVAFNMNAIKSGSIATLSAGGGGGSSPVRAYVVESDITDIQRLNEKIRSKAKF